MSDVKLGQKRAEDLKLKLTSTILGNDFYMAHDIHWLLGGGVDVEAEVGTQECYILAPSWNSLIGHPKHTHQGLLIGVRKMRTYPIHQYSNDGETWVEASPYSVWAETAKYKRTIEENK